MYLTSYRVHIKGLDQVMTTKYADKVDFISIYIVEAHSSDEWRLPENDEIGVCYMQVRNNFNFTPLSVT
jgi:hypothetical protein